MHGDDSVMPGSYAIASEENAEIVEFYLGVESDEDGRLLAVPILGDDFDLFVVEVILWGDQGESLGVLGNLVCFSQTKWGEQDILLPEHFRNDLPCGGAFGRLEVDFIRRKIDFPWLAFDGADDRGGDDIFILPGDYVSLVVLEVEVFDEDGANVGGEFLFFGGFRFAVFSILSGITLGDGILCARRLFLGFDATINNDHVFSIRLAVGVFNFQCAVGLPYGIDEFQGDGITAETFVFVQQVIDS